MSPPACERAEPITPHVLATKNDPAGSFFVAAPQKPVQLSSTGSGVLSLLVGLKSTLFQTGTPRSGQSNEASRHRRAAQTSGGSKFARRLVGLRRSFVRHIPSSPRLVSSIAFYGDVPALLAHFLERTLAQGRFCTSLSTSQAIQANITGAMSTTLTANEEAQLLQTIEMFEVITQSQPLDFQSLEILKEAYFKLGRQKEVVNTSKRIAQAYVQLGQLSSAILEYESILQRYPDDPDVQTALAAIESKATSFTAPAAAAAEAETADKLAAAKKARERRAPTDVDDGKLAMQKIFVDGKLISLGDFSALWHTPDLHEPPGTVLEPFIQILADKGLVPLEKTLKLVSERSRLGFLPLDKYDIDIELARATCASAGAFCRLTG